MAMASALMIVAQSAFPAGAGAYAERYWNGHYATEPKTANGYVACVAASALTWVNQINKVTDDSAYAAGVVNSWYALGLGHNRYTYPAPGLDPRAWAWLLWKKLQPGSYSFHDYWWTNQGTANLYLEAGLYSSHAPVGALVAQGHHAVDVIGFSSTANPQDMPSTLNGFWIVDPMPKYNPDFHGTPIGNPPGTAGYYVAVGLWNSTYFTKYVEENVPNVIWKGMFVAVLRAKDGSPQPTKTYDTQPAKYSDTVGLSAASLAAPAAADVAYPDAAIADAVIGGIKANNLADESAFGSSLKGASVGRTLHVESLAADVPAYELAEVVSKGAVVAIAMAVHQADGLHFGALQPVSSDEGLPSASALKAAAAGVSPDATPTGLAWGWSDESTSPFNPFLIATDNGGHRSFITPGGKSITAVHLFGKP
jgi:hypothetical protein